jgi:hypothetical protein
MVLDHEQFHLFCIFLLPFLLSHQYQSLTPRILTRRVMGRFAYRLVRTV